MSFPFPADAASGRADVERRVRDVDEIAAVGRVPVGDARRRPAPVDARVLLPDAEERARVHGDLRLCGKQSIHDTFDMVDGERI